MTKKVTETKNIAQENTKPIGFFTKMVHYLVKTWCLLLGINEEDMWRNVKLRTENLDRAEKPVGFVGRVKCALGSGKAIPQHLWEAITEDIEQLEEDAKEFDGKFEQVMKENAEIKIQLARMEERQEKMDERMEKMDDKLGKLLDALTKGALAQLNGPREERRPEGRMDRADAEGILSSDLVRLELR